ncbi:hypothetical protein BH23ACT5_BH23ACT5_08120 [soil metagenome]
MLLSVFKRGIAVAIVATALVACTGHGPRSDRPVIPVAGEPEVGRAAIVEHGCGSCHRIPGIPNADALVGPPLEAWSRRAFVAGILPNSADNLARFIADPEAIRPGTAMPNLELDEQEVAAIVAYLFTLD